MWFVPSVVQIALSADRLASAGEKRLRISTQMGANIREFPQMGFNTDFRGLVGNSTRMGREWNANGCEVGEWDSLDSSDSWFRIALNVDGRGSLRFRWRKGTKNFNANGREYPQISANGVQRGLAWVGGEGWGTQREWGGDGTRMGANSEDGIRGSKTRIVDGRMFNAIEA